jgi:type I restriction enzyme M protein
MKHTRGELTIEQDEFLQRKAYHGQEKIAVPALLGLMNMVLHGVAAPYVIRKNTLEDNIRDLPKRFDVVLTNPPFGGTENPQIQSNFPIKATATELLFLQHIMRRLKPRQGARCGMVVPEGTLFRGGAFATVKKDLLHKFDLHTIVSLPSGTFAPYSDVKTALIFFERSGPTEEIWYYEMPLPEGLKKFSKGSPIQDEHFEEAWDLWQAWDAYRRGEKSRPEPTDHSWIVPIAEVEERDFDLSARNPNRDEFVDLPHPAELTATLLERVRELHETVENLHALVSDGDEEAQ